MKLPSLSEILSHNHILQISKFWKASLTPVRLLQSVFEQSSRKIISPYFVEWHFAIIILQEIFYL